MGWKEDIELNRGVGSHGTKSHWVVVGLEDGTITGIPDDTPDAGYQLPNTFVLVLVLGQVVHLVGIVFKVG